MKHHFVLRGIGLLWLLPLICVSSTALGDRAATPTEPPDFFGASISNRRRCNQQNLKLLFQRDFHSWHFEFDEKKRLNPKLLLLFQSPDLLQKLDQRQLFVSDQAYREETADRLTSRLNNFAIFWQGKERMCNYAARPSRGEIYFGTQWCNLPVVGWILMPKIPTGIPIDFKRDPIVSRSLEYLTEEVAIAILPSSTPNLTGDSPLRPGSDDPRQKTFDKIWAEKSMDSIVSLSSPGNWPTSSISDADFEFRSRVMDWRAVADWVGRLVYKAPGVEIEKITYLEKKQGELRVNALVRFIDRYGLGPLNLHEAEIRITSEVLYLHLKLSGRPSQAMINYFAMNPQPPYLNEEARAFIGNEDLWWTEDLDKYEG